MKNARLPQRQVHLDFHTSECIDGVGSRFDKAQFQRCLKKGHVNSITLFAKCHHGWAYFPSETNEIHPGLHGFDLLSAQLEACAEIGVAAPIYISAGLDEKYYVAHPEAAVMYSREHRLPVILERDGHRYANEASAHYHDICMNTPYLDILAAQVAEVVRKFRPCGIFLDIVGERVCFCPSCRRSVRELGWDENDDESFRKLSRIVYKKYYDTVNAAARAEQRDIRIFHNGGHILCGRRDMAYADTHLELESLPTGGWGYDHFPRSAKYVHQLGMDYLGMTGKFHLTWGEFGGFKHPNALRYEVALSLALGASCSVGDQMHPYGFLDDATYELIGEAYGEAEKVEQYCYGVEPIADIGLLQMEAIGGAAAKNHPADIGACRILLEGKYLFDVLDTESDLSKYKLLILPDGITLSEPLTEKLRAFVSGGGKLLCSGSAGLDGEGNFAFDLGAEMIGKSAFCPSYYRPDDRALGLSPTSYVFYSELYDVRASDGATVLGYSRIPFFNRTPEHFCSHKHTPFAVEDHAPGVTLGRDGGYIAWNIFREYCEVGSYILKDTVCRLIDRLLPERSLETSLASAGVVALNRQTEEHRHVLHLLYAIPITRGSSVQVIEDLPTVCDTRVSLRVGEVSRVRLVPQNVELPFEMKDGVCSFAVERFSCSQIIVIEH